MQNFKIDGKVSTKPLPAKFQMEKFVVKSEALVEDHSLLIESGIKIPKPRGFWAQQARQMNNGDSVLFKDENDAISLRYALIYIGARPVKRLMRQEKGWRVWRLEK